MNEVNKEKEGKKKKNCLKKANNVCLCVCLCVCLFVHVYMYMSVC